MWIGHVLLTSTTHPPFKGQVLGQRNIRRIAIKARIRLRLFQSLKTLLVILQNDLQGLAQVIERASLKKHTRSQVLKTSAERLLTIRRGHWTIENKVHWVRDVVFREDVSPVRCGAIPQVPLCVKSI